MEFRNDLEKWHKYREMAEHFAKTAKFQEIHLINECIFYVFDNSFEEYCRCKKVKRKGDFHSEEECWKCEFYEMSKREK